MLVIHQLYNATALIWFRTVYNRMVGRRRRHHVRAGDGHRDVEEDAPHVGVPRDRI